MVGQQTPEKTSQKDDSDTGDTRTELKKVADSPAVEDCEEVWELARRKQTALHDLWIVLGLGD